MRLKSIDTTPNPNSMKLNMDGPVKLPDGVSGSFTYTAEKADNYPADIVALLSIAGVKSVFACADFLTINRDPLADWKKILEQAALIFAADSVESRSESATISAGNDEQSAAIEAKRLAAQKEGQVQVLVQTFKNIPIQVKVTDGKKEVRISLGAKFDDAAKEAQERSGADFLKERFWADHGVRYGPLDEIANEVADEIRGTFDPTKAGASALHLAENITSIESLAAHMQGGEWHKRLAAVQTLSNLPASEETLFLLIQALHDSVPQVRRLASAALGASGSDAAVEPLCRTLLSDNNVGVRRTAGDALSDIGAVGAEPSVCIALGDPNKLVRWRAARFLSDIGTVKALDALRAAADDQEFEVRLEIEAAIQRIEGGGLGLGPAWRRIVEQG